MEYLNISYRYVATYSILTIGSKYSTKYRFSANYLGTQYIYFPKSILIEKFIILLISFPFNILILFILFNIYIFHIILYIKTLI